MKKTKEREHPMKKRKEKKLDRTRDWEGQLRMFCEKKNMSKGT